MLLVLLLNIVHIVISAHEGQVFVKCFGELGNIFIDAVIVIYLHLVLHVLWGTLILYLGSGFLVWHFTYNQRLAMRLALSSVFMGGKRRDDSRVWEHTVISIIDRVCLPHCLAQPISNDMFQRFTYLMEGRPTHLVIIGALSLVRADWGPLVEKNLVPIIHSCFRYACHHRSQRMLSSGYLVTGTLRAVVRVLPHVPSPLREKHGILHAHPRPLARIYALSGRG